MVEMATRWHTCIIQRYHHHLICIAILSEVERESQQREDQFEKESRTNRPNYKNTVPVKMQRASLNNLIHSNHASTRYLFFVMFITSFEHSNKLFWIITPEDARSLHKNSIKSMTLNFTALPFYHSTAQIRFSSLCHTGAGEGQKLFETNNTQEMEAAQKQSQGHLFRILTNNPD